MENFREGMIGIIVSMSSSRYGIVGSRTKAEHKGVCRSIKEILVAVPKGIWMNGEK